jgi:hypothetical protein
MDAATIVRVEQLALDMQNRLGGRVRNLRPLVQGTGLILGFFAYPREKV